jgi:hypothetical protein
VTQHVVDPEPSTADISPDGKVGRSLEPMRQDHCRNSKPIAKTIAPCIECGIMYHAI